MLKPFDYRLNTNWLMTYLFIMLTLPNYSYNLDKLHAKELPGCEQLPRKRTTVQSWSSSLQPQQVETSVIGDVSRQVLGNYLHEIQNSAPIEVSAGLEGAQQEVRGLDRPTQRKSHSIHQ